MNRRRFLLLSSIAVTAPWLGSLCVSTVQAAQRIGTFSLQQFRRLNRDSIAAVAAIPPQGPPLSSSDRTLMAQMAAGGTMQLELSRLALQRATLPDVRILAEAEFEEQTGLSAKLNEIAAERNITPPVVPRRRINAMLTRLGALSGPQFDRTYLLESGVRGHQLLDVTMTRVIAQAQDSTLRNLATTARPLVQTHLQVSLQEISQLGA